MSSQQIHSKPSRWEIRIRQKVFIPVMAIHIQREGFLLTETFLLANVAKELQVKFLPESLHSRAEEDDMSLRQ